MPVGSVIRYTYDDADRLVEASYDNGDRYAYTYDAVGNRTAYTLTQSAVAPQVTHYSYDDADRLTTIDGRTVTHDDRGNLTSDGAWTYTYDAAGRMVAAESITATLAYTYNGDGLLLAENNNGADLTFTWDQALPLPQVLGTSNGLRALYGLQRLGVYQASDWYYPQADALGSVRQWTDAQGTVLGLQGYGPYGEALVPLGPPLAPWGYTGEWTEPSGLVYLRARWYNPAWGRFTQVDPVAGALARPLAHNAYLYALANPLCYVDPSGLWPGDPPPPRYRYLFDKWMRDVGLPWLYQVYTDEGWGEHWGIDLDTIARGYIAGELAAYYSDQDRGEIIAQSILESICHTYDLDLEANLGLAFVRVPIIEGLRHTDMLALGMGAKMEQQYAQLVYMVLAFGAVASSWAEPGEGEVGSGPQSAGGPLGRGSTGRSTPRTLEEQLAIEEVLENPAGGARVKLKKGMTDARWPAEEGWVKMTGQLHQNPGGSRFQVHYVYNTVTGQLDDVKITIVSGQGGK